MVKGESERAKYQKPLLITYGDIKDLTKGGNQCPEDTPNGGAGLSPCPG